MTKQEPKMTQEGIAKLLSDYNPQDVNRFSAYCKRLLIEKNRKTGALKNPWMQTKTDEALAELFKRVSNEGLVFDGEHITLQSTGISYDYIAYKNKMLLAYPESEVDVSLVYEGDEFNFKKESGKVTYTHNIADPFQQEAKNIIGGYMVVKNSRGESLTILTKKDIEQHRKVAKTDYIWSTWFKEMALKTVIKKGCKQHYADVFQGIEEMDNENYDLENPIDLELEWKGEIDAITTVKELAVYAKANRGRGAAFDKYVAMRKKALV